MGGNGDVDGDVSGEEAAWRELIARFDLPVETTGAPAPWPAREDLTERASDRPLPERDTAVGRDQAGPAGPASRPGPGSLPGPANRPGPGSLPGPANRPGPAGFAGPGRGPARPPGQDGTTGPDDARPQSTDSDATGAGSTGTGYPAEETGTRDAGAGETPGATPPQTGAPGGGRAARNGFPGDRARIVRRADPIPRPSPAGDAEDDDSRYVPPPPGPLPQLDPVAKGAWAGLLGGPGYLLLATVLGWQVADWAALVAIAAFVAGFATLVLRMSEGPRDDDDDGAVV